MTMHDAYVFAAYGVTAVTLAGLALWIRLDMTARRRELAELEHQGVRRRSEKEPTA